MGYGIVPNIYDENLVCQQPCEHKDCAANREQFGKQSKCRICGKGFVVGQKFYYEGKRPVHALCVCEEERKVK